MRHPIHRRARGVVLVVVLVMLVAVAFLSVGIMRNALTTDTVVNNARTQSVAESLAQYALRFCEEDLRNVGSATPTTVFTSSPAILAPSTTPRSVGSSQMLMAWEQASSWNTGGSAKTLTDSQLTSAGTPYVPANKPMCLAEYSPEPGLSSVVVLTVRAFSGDYQKDSSGKTVAGSSVWLQSRFLLSPIP